MPDDDEDYTRKVMKAKSPESIPMPASKYFERKELEKIINTKKKKE